MYNLLLSQIYPVIRFENINRAPCDMTNKFIFQVEMPAKHLLLLLRIWANNLKKNRMHV